MPLSISYQINNKWYGVGAAFAWQSETIPPRTCIARVKNKGKSCVCSVGEIPHKVCLNYHYYSWLGGPLVESHSLFISPRIYALRFATSVLLFYFQYDVWKSAFGVVCRSVGRRTVAGSTVVKLWLWIDGAGKQLFLIMRIVSIETCGFPLSLSPSPYSRCSW